MKVVVPGGTGYLGRALAEQLTARGDDVVVLTRGASATGAGHRRVHWDGETLGDWVQELDGADAIVHLTGKRVDTRSTKRNIDELIRSRVQPVALVGRALLQCATPPPVWVQSSSLAIFGDGGDTVIDEATVPSGIGPREMVTVVLAWESAFRHVSDAVARPVILRMGIGLGGDGDPATKKLAQLVRLGLGGRVGSGRQWVSWVALDDMLRVMLRALDDPSMSGVYHVTSPNPITNADMMATYRTLMQRRFGLPSPAIVAKLGAPLLGSSASLALVGRRVVPKRLLDAGFEFDHPDFAPTAEHALARLGVR